MEQKRKRVRRRVTSIFLALLLCVSSAMTVLSSPLNCCSIPVTRLWAIIWL